MAETAAETWEDARPYEPSLFDRFNNWVAKQPVRGWIFYVSIAIVLILVQVLFLWLERDPQAGVLLPVIIFNGLATPFLLGLIQLFDKQAVSALDFMRSALEMTDLEFGEYRYKLSNMPARAALVTGLTMLVAVILMEIVAVVPNSYAALEQLPTLVVVFQVIDKSSAFMYGVMIYHTIRQLMLVYTINSRYLRASLFNAGPSQAFSRLTASTAVGLVIGVYAWMLLNPELLAEPVSVGFASAFTILAVAVFVLPLWGVHKLMVDAKEKALHEIDLHFEKVFTMFNQRIREDDYTAIERLNGMISSLEIQQTRIRAIPTWPWRSDTVRSALTAIALPLVLWILQFLIEQAIGW